jgi:hypothetical protein
MTQSSLRLGNSGNGSLVVVMTSQQRLGQHHDLPTCLVLLHAAMRLYDLV